VTMKWMLWMHVIRKCYDVRFMRRRRREEGGNGGRFPVSSVQLRRRVSSSAGRKREEYTKKGNKKKIMAKNFITAQNFQELCLNFFLFIYQSR